MEILPIPPFNKEFNMKKLFLFALCTFSVSSFALTPRIETASNSDSFISFRTANDTIYWLWRHSWSNPQSWMCYHNQRKTDFTASERLWIRMGRAIFCWRYRKSLTCLCKWHPPLLPDSQILKDGETIKGKGWQCTASGDSLTCSNQEKHGFKISQAKQKLF